MMEMNCRMELLFRLVCLVNVSGQSLVDDLVQQEMLLALMFLFRLDDLVYGLGIWRLELMVNELLLKFICLTKIEIL